jgi:hypothetical protein
MALIRTNGNLTQTTGLTDAEFIAEWLASVRGKYGD